MKKKHILVISQYFYPEQFRINDICKEWVKRGYQVTVITGIPNYPSGSFFPGYDWFHKRKEEYGGGSVIRIPLIPRKKGSLMLALNYLSFVLSGGIWSLFTRIKADYVFIFEVSPMTQALPGVWYAKRRQIPCYLYVQDLWPDNVEIITGIHNKTIIGGIDKMVQYVYKRCKLVFVTSQSFKETLEERNVPAEKVIYWPQYAEDFYQPVQKKKTNDAFTIVFTGNIGYAQGLDILPKAAELLKEDNVSFLMVGDGRYKAELEQEITERNLSEMFQFVGQVKAEEIPIYLAQADMAFVSFKDSPLFEKTIPAKLQSYMACGMPILAAANGETKRIIEEAECGVCTPLGDPVKLAETIRRFLQNDDNEMRKNAVWFSNDNFAKKNLLDFIEQFF